jgi:hypothetical protein
MGTVMCGGTPVTIALLAKRATPRTPPPDPEFFFDDPFFGIDKILHS